MKVLRLLGGVVATLLVVAGGALVYISQVRIPSYTPQRVDLKVEVTPERVARGKRTVDTLCAACHLDNDTGTLAGRPILDLPPQFGKAYSANITRDPDLGIAGWSDGEIAYLLRTGVRRDGRYAPPWMVKLPHMADEDLLDVIAFLRSDDPLVKPTKVRPPASEPSLLTALLTRVAWKPLPYPKAPIVAPDPKDRVAVGRYLVHGRALCFACHSADFAKNDDLVPEESAGYLGGGNAMPDLQGRTVLTANLTPEPETGIGKWSEDDFVRALRTGVRPDRTVVAYPMEPYPEFTDDEARAIYAYLRTVPPIRNAVARTVVRKAGEADAGRAAYIGYGCNSCHGETGVGRYDLRKGHTDFPTDVELIAYIRDPQKLRPGIKMPTWDGVIAEADYAPLAAYVRRLGAEPHRKPAP